MDLSQSIGALRRSAGAVSIYYILGYKEIQELEEGRKNGLWESSSDL